MVQVKMFLLVALLISGCTQKFNRNAPIINQEESSGKPLSYVIQRKKEYSIAKIMEFDLQYKKMGNPLDYCVSDDYLYLLYRSQIVRVNLVNGGVLFKTLVRRFKNLSIIDKKIVLHSNSSILVMDLSLNKESERKFNFKSNIIKIIKHNNQRIIVTMNGKCRSFNQDFSEEIWESIATNAFLPSIVGIINRGPTLLILNGANKLITIDLDTGDFISVESVEGGHTSLCKAEDLILVGSDENMFIRKDNEVKIYEVADLERVLSKGKSIFIINKSKIMVTDKDSIVKGNYFSILEKNNEDIFFTEKCVIFKGIKNLNVYSVSGKFLTSIAVAGKVKIIDLGDIIVVLDSKSCKMYKVT